ncbi:MAG: ribonuclease E/G [Holosporales bacterium]|jgi:ribonuclease E|nr:ribonuclease E/G [Holosporales bacterium]
MSGKLLIDASCADETRIAVVGTDGRLEVFETECSSNKPIKGNIYLAKVVRIEPSIQAAFIDYGGSKHGFLPLTEIHYEYFNKNIAKAISDRDAVNDTEDGTATEKHTTYSPKIQEVIAQKQIVLVQAEKEIRGNKCAFFSTFISLPGRYCVLMPKPPKGMKNAVSKRLEASEKERLKEIIQTLEVPDKMNCIVRTAGESRTKQEITRDFEYLCRLWDEIREKVTSSAAPSLIYEEGNIIKRSIRDLYQRNMDGIIVHGREAYREARSFMHVFTPTQIKKVVLHEGSGSDLFSKYGIEDSVAKILSPVVPLPSGGSIVINTTEALTAIDVNSGKMKNERDMDGTALRTNLEAAVEIARQIKLRDIAGIIVIDFIDVDDSEAATKVERKMREVMKGDSANVRIGRLSQFGLIEMSRQRMRMGIAESSFVQCPHCEGSGRVLSDEATAISVIRKIERELITKKAQSVVAEMASGVAFFILNHKRKLLAELESTHSTFVEIMPSTSLTSTECNVTVKEPRISEFLTSSHTKPPNGAKQHDDKPPVKSQEAGSHESPNGRIANRDSKRKSAPTNASAPAKKKHTSGTNGSQRPHETVIKRTDERTASNSRAAQPPHKDNTAATEKDAITARKSRNSWFQKIFSPKA